MPVTETMMLEILLEAVLRPRPSLLMCSEKVIEIAKLRKLDASHLSTIFTIYGLTDKQGFLYMELLVESKAVFEDASHTITPEIAEYVHAMLESKL